MTIYLVLLFILGMVNFYIVFKNPSNFLTLFLVSVIITSGLMVYGYPVVDEYFILILLLGFICRHLMNTDFIIKINRRLNLHDVVFITLVMYLLFQSLRGMLWLEDFRMLRWIAFFIIIGLSYFVINNYKYEISAKHITKVIIYSVTFYFSMYFMIGIIYEIFTHGSKNDLQGNFWTGSSVAVFPVLIFISSFIIYQQYEQKITSNLFSISKSKLFIILSFAIVVWTIIFYDSRAAIITVLGVLFLRFFSGIKKLGKKQIGHLFLLLLFFSIYHLWLINFSTSQKGVFLYLPVDAELSVRLPDAISLERDSARYLAPQVAINLIGEDKNTLLFGYGLYTSRYVMNDRINEMRKKNSLYKLDFSGNKTYSAAGIVAIFVDTGLVGLFLLLANLYFGALRILKSMNKERYIILIIYLSSFLWLFIGNPTVMLLFYFLIMPGNLFQMMLEGIPGNKFNTK